MFYTEKKLLNIFYIKNLFCGYFPEVTIFTILQVFKKMILVFGTEIWITANCEMVLFSFGFTVIF